MFEGCLQTMAFYLTAQGTTLTRDGWRFEPVPEVAYTLQCRGQVTPGTNLLIYELFVDAFASGPIPTLTSDLLCTVDGLKIFHCCGMQLRLVPSWPLESRRALQPVTPQTEPCARLGDQIFDFASLLACAWGKPSAAFGSMYRAFDDIRRCPHLLGPPYHFISRVTNIDAEAGSVKSGGTLEVAYDIPPDAWYFSENGARIMPFCVLLEVALQPCGWLASYIECALDMYEDLFFRNLDGTGTLHADITPHAGTLTTRVINRQLSRTGSMTIVGFDVGCFLGDTLVYEMNTTFGFSPPPRLPIRLVCQSMRKNEPNSKRRQTKILCSKRDHQQTSLASCDWLAPCSSSSIGSPVYGLRVDQPGSGAFAGSSISMRINGFLRHISTVTPCSRVLSASRPCCNSCRSSWSKPVCQQITPHLVLRRYRTR